MSNLAVRVMPEPVRSTGFASITATYTGIGAPFDNPVHWFMVQNLSDQPVMISWDGINDHFPLPINGYVIMDVASNKTLTGGSFMVAQGTRFYVKTLGVALPTVGSVYLSIFYGFING
jgi:hypothetical protein